MNHHPADPRTVARRAALAMMILAVLATSLATSATNTQVAHAQSTDREVRSVFAVQPSVPTGVRLVWQSESIRWATWNPVPGADYYNYSHCYGDTGTPSQCRTNTSSNAPSQLWFLEPVMHLAVQAVNSEGASPWSPYVRVAKSIPDTPTDVEVINNTIRWDSSNGAESYSVELCAQSNCDVIDNVTCCSYAPSNLSRFEYVRVKAANGAGESSWSDAALIRMVVSLPNPPTGVSIISGRVTWNPVSGADWYNIEIDRPNGGSLIVNIPCCSFILGRDNTGGATHISVQAANSTATSPWSVRVSVPADLQKPDTPTGVRFDSGRITWNAVAGAESYGVALCSQTLGCVHYLQLPCCSYTPSDLRDVTHINVYAVNSAGHSELSQNVPIPQTVQVPDAPSGLDF